MKKKVGSMLLVLLCFYSLITNAQDSTVADGENHNKTQIGLYIAGGITVLTILVGLWYVRRMLVKRRQR